MDGFKLSILFMIILHAFSVS